MRCAIRVWLKRILCGLSVMLALATVAIWIYVAFYGGQQISWQGERGYALGFDMYMYRVDVLSCYQRAVEIHGHKGLILSETPVSMRGAAYYVPRRGHGFYFERVRSWSVENPARPLPAPVPIAGGGTLKTELAARGVSFGVPFWFVTVLGLLLPPSWMATRTATARSRASKHLRRAKLRLCMRCGYDLRATPERCPECGTVAEARPN